ncbi:MAG: energy-coupling factor ABC transporter permease [Candidatus Sifarchaeia archaeon]
MSSKKEYEERRMHVPDGIVPIWLQIMLLVVSALMMGIAYGKIKTRFNERLVPYMGVLAAVIFAAQLVNFPVPPFSSGHLVGSTLLAVMLEPWPAMIIMALVLFVQALYGDGGILTYGLNLFNMGVFSVLLGYTLALFLFRLSKRAMSKEKAILLSAGITSFVVTVSAAFVLGLELFTVPGFGIEALAAITGVHIIIGIGEALLTTVILLYFVKASPRLVSFLQEKNDDKQEEEFHEEQTIPSRRQLIKQTIPVLAASIIITALAVLLGIASENPDGFEWALFVFAGVTEPEHGFEGIFTSLGEGQFLDIFLGSLGILIALGLGFMVFRKTTNERSYEKTDKFLLPFNEGKDSRSIFSSTGMLLSAIAIAVIISLQNQLSIVLTIIGVVLVTGWFLSTHWSRVISLAAKFEMIILFWVFFEPFLFGSTVMLTISTPWGPLYAYYEGLYLGLLLGSRMFAILLTFLAVLSHMKLTEFIEALRTLRIPASILGSLMIMLRYVPLFMEERSRMHEAQLLRGYSRGKRLERIKSVGYLVGTSINRSFDRSATVYEAMSLRGFGKGTMVSGSGFKHSDILLPILVLVFVLSLPFLVSIIMEVLML